MKHKSCKYMYFFCYCRSFVEFRDLFWKWEMWKKHIIMFSFRKIVYLYTHASCMIYLSLSYWTFTQTSPGSGKSAEVCVVSHSALSVAGEWPVGIACRCEISRVVVVVLWKASRNSCCHAPGQHPVPSAALPLESLSGSSQGTRVYGERKPKCTEPRFYTGK